MASTYSLLEYDSDEERARSPAGTPLGNLVAAALFMRDLLTGAGIQYALLGGLLLRLTGSPHDTRAVDLAFKAPRGMRDLWDAVSSETRLVVPDTKLISGVMKTFVRTGPDFDPSCPQSALVEVNLVESGTHGIPRDLSAHLRPVAVDTGSGQVQTLQGLDLLYTLRSKMGAFSDRRLDRDLNDIRFLLANHRQEVRQVADRLDAEAVECFLSTVPEETLADWRAFFGL